MVVSKMRFLKTYCDEQFLLLCGKVLKALSFNGSESSATSQSHFTKLFYGNLIEFVF
jgi:hypothetical protein